MAKESFNKDHIEQYRFGPGSLCVIHAEAERWLDIAQSLETIKDPALQGIHVIFLEPGEKLSALSEAELLAAGLKVV